ncbi:MAG: hypothetical protein DWI22_08470 [Planctomycetota bacterium]|nr:MAG: hypothetical protein DWI22_08470 [Planctomycetota bacterium]
MPPEAKLEYLRVHDFLQAEPQPPLSWKRVSAFPADLQPRSSPWPGMISVTECGMPITLPPNTQTTRGTLQFSTLRYFVSLRVAAMVGTDRIPDDFAC